MVWAPMGSGSIDAHLEEGGTDAATAMGRVDGESPQRRPIARHTETGRVGVRVEADRTDHLAVDRGDDEVGVTRGRRDGQEIGEVGGIQIG